MNKRLASISSKDVDRILRKYGFQSSRIKGSHIQYVGYVSGNKRRVTVISNRKVFPLGTLKSMINQSGLTEEDWIKII